MITNKANNVFLHHVLNDKLAGKLFHQCALHIDKFSNQLFIQNVITKKIKSFIS
jgi:N-acetylglucosamine kinase-like BadF-type ATPase